MNLSWTMASYGSNILFVTLWYTNPVDVASYIIGRGSPTTHDLKSNVLKLLARLWTVF